MIPYNKWEFNCTSLKKPSYMLFATGIGGVLYPPNSLYKCALDIERVKNECLRADDVWLKVMEMLAETKVTWTRCLLIVPPDVKQNQSMDYIGPITSKRLKDKFGEFYKKISNRDFLQEWALKIGVTVCPYCNRNFIFTVPRHTGNGGVRPEYDHFFPKSKYPYLAASMYNLIPSCSVCNKAKSNRNSYKNHEVQYLYPYEEGYGEQIVLKIEDKNKPTDKVTAWLGSAEEYTVYPECSKEVDSEKKKRVENSWEMFKLGPLYEKHSDYIRNILQAKQIYTEEYLEQLVKNFPSAFDSMDDLKNMVYFNYLDEKDWGKRILAKLTHDLEADNP